MYYSFDVFDTTIVRLLFNYKDIFIAVGHKLLEIELINNLFEWLEIRLLSEQESRSGKEETNIQDIYKIISEKLNWNECQRDRAMSIEIQVEKEHISIIGKIKDDIIQLKHHNENIIYISDMYLPVDFFIKVFSNHGIKIEEKNIFISSEIGLSKRSGNIYNFVIKKLGVSPSDILHTGDNYKSDYLNARASGLNAHYFDTPNKTKYEKLLYDDKCIVKKIILYTIKKNPITQSYYKKCYNNYISTEKLIHSYLAGISRAVRLTKYYNDIHKNSIWETASNVIGPLMFGFVLWVLEEAKKNKYNRIYFLARDGFMLCKIAKIVSKKWGFDIDCKYLYVSRQSVLFPAIKSIKEVDFNRMYHELYTNYTFRTICEYLNIEIEEIQDVLNEYDINKISYDKVLFENDINFVKEVFSNTYIESIIIMKATEYNDNLQGYLRQEGLFNDPNYAVVDIGWEGKIHNRLSEIIRQKNPKFNGLTGYYLGISSNKFDRYPDDIRNSWIMHHNKICSYTIAKAMILLEIFFSADHGSTIKYQNNNNIYHPIMNVEKSKNVIDWGIYTQHRAILQYTTMLCKTCKYDNKMSLFLKKFSVDVIRTIWHYPDYYFALAYSKFPFSASQLDNVHTNLCKEIDFKTLIKFFLTGKITDLRNPWIQGCIVISKFKYKRLYLLLALIRDNIGLFRQFLLRNRVQNIP